MSRRSLCSGLVVVVLSWPRWAFAYRPFDGTDAGVAEPGEVELEVGPAGYRRQGSSRFVVAPALVANYGFAPGFEVVIEGQQDLQLAPARRLGQIRDVAVSVKALLRRGSLQNAAGVSVALEVGALLPGVERRLGTHVASLFSLRLPAITLHLNLDNDLLFAGSYVAGASLILEGAEAWRVRPVAELLVEREFGRADFSDGLNESILVGTIVRWSDALSFDAGLRYGRVEARSAEELRAGLTWVFEPW